MSIPEKILTQHIAILGKTGSGKTFTAKGIAERILREKGRVCIIDPIGAWYGLRSDSTGKHPAFPIVVFGGEHGDCPLGQNHGAALAEIIGTTDTSAVLDTRLMTVGERTRFFTDFGEALLRKNRGPLHVIIDEAHLFIPQGRVNDPQSGKMLHAGNNLVSLGRGVGLRVTMISQRPAKLHKDSLTQAETLIAMRLIAPQDRAAVEDWIGEWASPAQGKELLRSLPSLPTGEGWIWSPEIGLLEHQKFPKITTYDSSRAPDGETGKIVLANIDLPAIQQRLEKVASDAFQNDPARLRARIAELERAARVTVVPAPEVQRVEIPVLNEKHIETLGALVAQIDDLVGRFTAAAKDISGALSKVLNQPPPTVKAQVYHESPKPPKMQPASNGHQQNIGGGLRRMMVALAQRNGLSARQLGVRAGMSSSSGTFGTYLAKGRTEGWLDGSRDRITITQTGVNALGDYEPLPEGPALLDYWLGELSGGARTMLLVLSQHPRGLSADELGEKAGLSYTSGTFGTYLSKLRTLELITGSRDNLKASEELF